MLFAILYYTRVSEKVLARFENNHGNVLTVKVISNTNHYIGADSARYIILYEFYIIHIRINRPNNK